MADMWTGFRPWEQIQQGAALLNGGLADYASGRQELPQPMQDYLNQSLGVGQPQQPQQPQLTPAMRGLAVPQPQMPMQSSPSDWAGWAPSQPPQDEPAVQPGSGKLGAYPVSPAPARQGPPTAAEAPPPPPPEPTAPAPTASPDAQLLSQLPPGYRWKQSDLPLLKEILPLVQAKVAANSRVTVANVNQDGSMSRTQLRETTKLQLERLRQEGLNDRAAKSFELVMSRLKEQGREADAKIVAAAALQLARDTAALQRVREQQAGADRRTAATNNAKRDIASKALGSKSQYDLEKLRVQGLNTYSRFVSATQFLDPTERAEALGAARDQLNETMKPYMPVGQDFLPDTPEPDSTPSE